MLTVTNAVRGTVSNLLDNITYAFAVTAFNAGGESDFSDEVIAQWPFPYTLEAERGSVDSPMFVALDPTASGGAYVTSPNNNLGSVEFEFYCASNTTVFVWCLARDLPDEPLATDSFFWKIDGLPERIWHLFYNQQRTGTWQWDRLSTIESQGGVVVYTSPFPVNLEPGFHTLNFRSRESRTRLDKIIIADSSSFSPIEQKKIPTTTGVRVILIHE